MLQDVLENVKVVLRRLEKAEEQLSASNARSQPVIYYSESLPITEILEELDEEGNVICKDTNALNLAVIFPNVFTASSTTKPGEAALQVADALRKAGLEEEFPPSQAATILGIDDAKRPLPQEGNSVELQFDQAKLSEVVAAPPLIDRKEGQISLATISEPVASGKPKSRRKKSVTFADDTKDAETMDISLSREVTGAETRAVRPVKRIYSTEHVFDATPESLEEDESPPIIPTDESREDAALRRQMLQYSMNEVGAVVAEIDLDESGSQTSYSSEEDGDEQYTSSADEEEDAFGRTTRRVLNDDYLREMQGLERKLNTKVMQNVGPNMPEILDDLEQPISDKGPSPELLTSSTQAFGKKGVRFADEVDISTPPVQDSTNIPKCGPTAPPVHEAVIERTTPSEEAAPAPTSGKKVSRFKSSRTAAVATSHDGKRPINPVSTNPVANGPLSGDVRERKILTGSPSLHLTPASESKPKAFSGAITFTHEDRTRQVPEGPADKTVAETLIERPIISDGVDVPEPEEFDPALMHQDVAVVYHKMRNRMIQRNGGFMPKAADEEEQRVPLTEEEGGERKVSRFKAARLARVGK